MNVDCRLPCLFPCIFNPGLLKSSMVRGSDALELPSLPIDEHRAGVFRSEFEKNVVQGVINGNVLRFLVSSFGLLKDDLAALKVNLFPVQTEYLAAARPSVQKCDYYGSNVRRYGFDEGGAFMWFQIYNTFALLLEPLHTFAGVLISDTALYGIAEQLRQDCKVPVDR